MKKVLTLSLAVICLVSCEQNTQPTSPVEDKESLDLVGTRWICQDGVSQSGDHVYYHYMEAVVINDNEIYYEPWTSSKQLHLTSTTDLLASGCEWGWRYALKNATYKYQYPVVYVSYNNAFLGKATISTDHKTATLELADATLAPVTLIRLDNKWDIINDPWANTVWRGNSMLLNAIVLGNYKFAHLHTNSEGILDVKYDYRQIGNDNLPYFELTYVVPNSSYEPESIIYVKYTYSGQLENIPNEGYRFVVHTRYFNTYTTHESEMWHDIDTLQQRL